MKKLLFASLFFAGLLGGNAQTYWKTYGNCVTYGQFEIPPTLYLGTKNCIIGSGGLVLDFDIIRADETMARFEQDLVILAPNSPTEVLIGDPLTPVNNGYKLYVNGGILTDQVLVAYPGSPQWPDYVFYADYDLMPLPEVEAFINKYGHLPNIPSAEKLAKEGGIDLGKMQAAQMAKIEELTLHLIQKNKEIKALQKQVEILSKQMELLLEKQ